jgi:orotate phosphoribosyltransferase
VISIANLSDLFSYLSLDPAMAQHKDAVAAYRAQYGVTE